LLIYNNMLWGGFSKPALSKLRSAVDEVLVKKQAR
jgi:hypothetical protein